MNDARRPPKDDQLFTPQGGGGGTGSTPMGHHGDEPSGVSLPQVKTAQAGGEAGPLAAGPAIGPGGPPQKKEASALRLLMTLALAGAMAGAVLVFVFLWSQPKILAYRALVLREAVLEVLKGPHDFESLFVVNGELVAAAQLPAGVDTLSLDRVFLGHDETGNPVGFAMEAEGFGFQDIIGLIFGYDPSTGQVIGMKVLRHLETPGLGDKIVKDSVFVAAFDGAAAPLLGVKPDRNTGESDQVDMITGATISSKAVIRIINERIAAMAELLAAYQAAGGTGEEGR